MTTERQKQVALALADAEGSLDQAWHYLRDALSTATGVEAIVLMPLIRQAAELRGAVAALSTARNADLED